MSISQHHKWKSSGILIKLKAKYNFISGGYENGSKALPYQPGKSSEEERLLTGV